MSAIPSYASGAVVDAANRHNHSDLTHTSLFLVAHVAMTVSDASVHFHILSGQHLSAHLGMVSSLKFAPVMIPACGHGCFDVV